VRESLGIARRAYDTSDDPRFALGLEAPARVLTTEDFRRRPVRLCRETPGRPTPERSATPSGRVLRIAQVRDQMSDVFALETQRHGRR
jgi:hypothetical protein